VERILKVQVFLGQKENVEKMVTLFVLALEHQALN
jgi:hypothetical protein